MALPTRALGRTGIDVTHLGLGGLFVSRFASERDAGVAAIRRAIDLGVTFIDTAPGYSDSEEVVGEALRGVTTPVVISTKLGGRPKPFEPQNAGALAESVEQSLRHLGRDVIDILLIHEPDRPRQYAWWTDEANAEGPVMEVLGDLKHRGLIRATGVAGTTCAHLAHLVRTDRFDVVLTAFNYSLLYREADEEVIPDAVERDMGVILGSPLQQGVFAKRFDDEVRANPIWLSRRRREQFLALYALADEAGLPMPELAMRFVYAHAGVSSVLTGARSIEEVEDNVRIFEQGPLPADLLARLETIAAMVPYRPCEEPFGLPLGRGYQGPGVAGR